MTILPGLDLNREGTFCHAARDFFAGAYDEPGQVGICTVDAAFAADDISSLCDEIPWRTQGQDLLVSGPVSVYVIRAAVLSREPARHRSLSSGATQQALSSWNSFASVSQYTGQCQRDTRLAHLCRLRTKLDRNCQTTVCRRTIWCRSERVSVCAGYRFPQINKKIRA